jgi:DNA-binding IclR family transcriptional regulator
MQETNTIYTVHNVNKALELLEVLAENSKPIALLCLAEQIGLSRNKTFRLLTTLCEKGLVERDAVTGAYQLGAYTVALGQKFMHSSSLVNYAHPIMEELARKHDEAVYLTVIKDDDVLFLNMVDCAQEVKAAPFVGRKFPFFTIAAGKVMKALDSRDLLEKLCRKNDRKLKGPDFDRLENELLEIRSKGVAVDNGGLEEGIISVAVAVKDYAGKVIGAITLLGPSFRMMAERIENEIIPSMLEGAELLSERFGYARA